MVVPSQHRGGSKNDPTHKIGPKQAWKIPSEIVRALLLCLACKTSPRASLSTLAERQQIVKQQCHSLKYYGFYAV